MTIVYGLLGLGFLVFWHELGHYIASNLCGVKVEAFSVGMGPVLLHKKSKKSGTDWRLSLIPFGGYCAMKGEKDYQAALDLGLTEIRGEKDSFYGIHPLKRLLIAFAGPFANLIFGLLAFFLIALVGYTYYSAGTKVRMADEVYEGIESPAHQAGMETGDKILSINGNEMEDFSSIAKFVSTHPDEDLIFLVERENQAEPILITVHSVLDKESGAGKIGIVSDPNSVEIKEKVPKGFFPSIAEAFSETGELIGLTIKSIGILFKGVKVTNAVSGPARITSMLGSTIKAGFTEGFRSGIVYTLDFLALISISLFITNLLPVPVLDGGLIIFSFVEWITRKKLSPKFLYRIQIVGIIFIALLMVLAIGSDILYFFKK